MQLLLRMRTGLFQAGSAIVDPAEPADRMSVIVTGRSTRPLPAPAPRPRRPLAPLRHLGRLSANGYVYANGPTRIAAAVGVRMQG